MPGGGQDRVGICELSKFGQRVDEPEYAPDQRCGRAVGQFDLEREARVGLRVTDLAGLHERHRTQKATVGERDQPPACARQVDQRSAAQAGGVEFATGDQEDGCRRAEDRVGVVVERAGVKGGG